MLQSHRFSSDRQLICHQIHTFSQWFIAFPGSKNAATQNGYCGSQLKTNTAPIFFRQNRSRFVEMAANLPKLLTKWSASGAEHEYCVKCEPQPRYCLLITFYRSSTHEWRQWRSLHCLNNFTSAHSATTGTKVCHKVGPWIVTEILVEIIQSILHSARHSMKS